MLDFLKNIVNPTKKVDQPKQTEVKPETEQKPDTELKPETETKSETETKPETETKQILLPSDNAIESREYIINAIIQSLEPMQGLSKDKFNGLTIYITEQRLQLLTEGKDFLQHLCAQMDNHGFESLSDLVAITNDTAPNNAITVMPGMRLMLHQKESKGGEELPPPATGKMRIFIFEGQGSMQQAEYILNAKEKQVFHIGRIKFVRDLSPRRINDVVIKDDESVDELKKLNSKVSRSHADIIWRDGMFFIKAMRGGCRPEGGAATKVIRNEQETEMLTSNMLYPLRDGDLIELGKAVILQVNIFE